MKKILALSLTLMTLATAGYIYANEVRITECDELGCTTRYN